MKANLRSLTLLYTVALAFGVSFAVGGAMYGLSSHSLRLAYESRCQASAREAAQQLLDPVYRLDAFGVKRLQDVFHEVDPSLAQSFVVDRDGLMFSDGSETRNSAPTEEIKEVLASGTWSVRTSSEPWLLVGPIVDAMGETHGVAAFEFSTDELQRELDRMKGAAFGTALLVTLIGCVTGFVLARWATRPFDRLVNWVQDLSAQRLSETVPPSVRESSLEELRRLAEAVENMVERLDKTTVSLEVAESARQEAERADRLKTRFLANLSHEIRTPLHAVVGYSDLLRIEGAGVRYEERLEGIQIAVRSLLRLIDDILDLSKIESGNLVLNHDPLDLDQLVHEVIEITQVRADPAGLELRGSVHPGLVCRRLGDADRIRQILVNLVSNALKFTDHGQVTLEASALGDDRVRFVVQDTGRGIPEDEIENLFQPFARLVADSAKVSGSGLGLAICRQLAEAMGASLSLESMVGEGTRAIFDIPLMIPSGELQVPIPQAIPEIPGSAEPLTSHEGLRVLVIEDNPINQTVLSSMLDLMGCEVFLADNGELGVEAWHEHRPSIIFMDCSMPVLDGFEATRQIRCAEADRDGGGKETPIIALTAHARSDDKRRCRDAGMNAVLTKPLALDDLKEALDVWA